MSGVRHHVLPRFLLKGFICQKKGKQKFTWVYSKGKKPYKSNIINVSVESNFYGKEGECNADEGITKLERGYAVLIDKLRQESEKTGVVEVNEALIPDFISHLVIRTKHLRSSLYESTDIFLSELEKELSNFNNIKKIVFKKLQIEKPNTLVELLSSSKGSNFLDNHESELKKLFQLNIRSIKSQLLEIVKETHIKTLADNPNPQERISMYKQLKWIICNANSSLILGDTGCLFETDGSRRFKSFHDKNDNIKNIYLPISSNKMLIGSHSQISRIDFLEINEAIVKSSREFFVCSDFLMGANNILSLIGQESELIKHTEIQEIISRYFI
jgi:hypothetical protein